MSFHYKLLVPWEMHLICWTLIKLKTPKLLRVYFISKGILNFLVLLCSKIISNWQWITFSMMKNTGCSKAKCQTLHRLFGKGHFTKVYSITGCELQNFSEFPCDPPIRFSCKHKVCIQPNPIRGSQGNWGKFWSSQPVIE